MREELSVYPISGCCSHTFCRTFSPRLLFCLLYTSSWTTPGVLASMGCQVSIITDAPVIPQEYLPLCAGLAVKAGMDEFDALKAITINPAKHLGVEDRVGSLEVGKDGDIVVMSGSPLKVESLVKWVVIDGVVVYNN